MHENEGTDFSHTDSMRFPSFAFYSPSFPSKSTGTATAIFTRISSVFLRNSFRPTHHRSAKTNSALASTPLVASSTEIFFTVMKFTCQPNSTTALIVSESCDHLTPSPLRQRMILNFQFSILIPFPYAQAHQHTRPADSPESRLQVMIHPQAHRLPPVVAAPLEVRLRDHGVPAAGNHSLDDIELRLRGDVHEYERFESEEWLQEPGEDEGDAGAGERGQVVRVGVVVVGGHPDAGGGGWAAAADGRGGVSGGEPC